MATAMDVRPAAEGEVEYLARLWYDGWQDAHDAIVPPELTRVRTLESFRHRLAEGLSTVRVVGPVGAPDGFCMVKDDELYQLYVAARARGAGAAAALMQDAESRLSDQGIETAWLACAIGNERAARFYEKRGWRRIGVMINQLETLEGPFQLAVWRYEKTVGASARQP
jgi:ribosomal protein S18 acetylase RimI-like enzyme